MAGANSVAVLGKEHWSVKVSAIYIEDVYCFFAITLPGLGSRDSYSVFKIQCV